MKLLYEIKANSRGPAQIFEWQCMKEIYLAVVSDSTNLKIINRFGDVFTEFKFQHAIRSICWSPNGQYLAAISKGNNSLFLWSESNNKVQDIDSGFKEVLTCVSWSKDSTIVSCGSSAGNLLLYYILSKKKIPVLGKHTKAIMSSVWNSSKILALNTDDYTISISNNEGTTIANIEVGFKVKHLKFSQMKKSHSHFEKENTLSLISSKNGLYMINIGSNDTPMEIIFQEKYGFIVDYEWFGDGYLVIGFSNGVVVVMSSHIKEIYEEISKTFIFTKKKMTNFAVSLHNEKIAVSTTNRIEILSLKDIAQVDQTLEIPENDVQTVKWSSAGSYLAVGRSHGRISIYLYSLPLIYALNSTKIVHMSSITEITVVDLANRKNESLIQVALEPTLLAVNDSVIAVVMNSNVTFHSLVDQDFPVISKTDYVEDIEKLKINESFLVFLFDGRLKLSKIGDSSLDQIISKSGEESKILDFFLLPKFLIYHTKKTIFYYSFEKLCQSISLPQKEEIKRMFVSNVSSHLLICPDTINCRILIPFKETKKKIENFPSKSEHVIWSVVEDVVILLASNKTEKAVFTVTTEFDEVKITLVSKFKGTITNIPIYFDQSDVISLTETGSLISEKIEGLEQVLEEKIIRKEKIFENIDNLSYEEHQKTIHKLIEHGEITYAKTYALKIGDIKTVWALQFLEQLTDKKLIWGYSLMILKRYDEAQQCLLSSSNPMSALEMRIDLMHWNESMSLAKSLKYDNSGYIAFKYAQQLEITGNYGEAVENYKKAIENSKESEYREESLAGLARSLLQTGEIQKGTNAASRLKDQKQQLSCAKVSLELKLYKNAGMLFESAGEYDKAARAYVAGDLWDHVDKISLKINDRQILTNLAQYYEKREKFKEAAIAFENAGECVESIRILLTKFNDTDKAIRMAEKSKSPQIAQMISEFFQSIGDYRAAVRFLLRMSQPKESLKMAQQHNLIDFYVSLLGDENPREVYLELADVYLEKNLVKAARLYGRAGEYDKALNILLENPTNDSIDVAVDLIGETRDSSIHDRLINLAENFKNVKHLIRIYVNIKNYEKAVQISRSYSQREVEIGNYNSALEWLLEAVVQLQKKNQPLNWQLEKDLVLLQSYNLAKFYIKNNKHEVSSRLLMRVVGNIERFTTHAGLILRTTLVECYKAGISDFVEEVYEILRNPHYFKTLDERAKRQIENIYNKRKNAKSEDFLSPCPFCGSLLPSMELECKQCQKNLPFCVASGRHMVRDDWTRCPKCLCPANIKDLQSYVESEHKCPICDCKLNLEDIHLTV